MAHFCTPTLVADLEPVNPPDPQDPAADADGTPEPSLAEHEAQFGDAKARAAQLAEGEPTEGEPESPRTARGPDGKFVKPSKHRAAKAEAGADDPPRIAELTRKWREAERERDEWKARASAAPMPVAKPAEPAKSVAAAEKPKIESFQEYGDYVEALADWKIAEARRVDREERQREQQQTQLVTSWKTRVDEAKTRYSDYEQVALQSPTRIPQGSLVDAWVLEDDNGAAVLYELQKDSLAGGHLLDDILAMPNAIRQASALSQLSLRLSPSTRPQAAVTGAAAATVRQAAPRPPTPVRTSAMTTADEPPGDDASIAEHEKYYGQRRR